jgi:pyridoxine 5-phosphate synthase
VDPQAEHIQAAALVGADCVELHTGAYAEASAEAEAQRLFEELLAAAAHARQLGLKVKAGHGLDYRNIKRFRGRKEFEEYSIGHSIISRAVLVGLERAVREMIALING